MAILFAAACAGPGAGPPELPEATKALAICLYNNLKIMPGIVAVDAFVQENPGRRDATYAVIGYWLSDGAGKPAMNSLALSGPDRYPRPSFSLRDDSAGSVHYFQVAGQLGTKCQADWGYDDPVLIFSPPLKLPPLQKVDMARYAN